MPPSERYRHQVALLIETLPFVAAERDFALKGGTAINLFVRSMPRLSVDIDLTYLPVAGRTESLAAIDAGMKRMAVAIGKGIPGVKVNEVVNRAEGIVTKLTLQRADAQIKIESLPFFAAASSIPKCDPYVRMSRRPLVLRRHKSSRFPIFTQGKSSPPLTANILATFLTSAIFWRMRASATA